MPPSTEAHAAISETHDNFQANPSVCKGKDAFFEHSLEGPDPRRNFSWPVMPQTRTPVRRSSCSESGASCRKAPPKMHPARWRVQKFIDEPTKQLVVDLCQVCQRNTGHGAATALVASTRHHSAQYPHPLWQQTFVVGCASSKSCTSRHAVANVHCTLGGTSRPDQLSRWWLLWGSEEWATLYAAAQEVDFASPWLLLAEFFFNLF